MQVASTILRCLKCRKEHQAEEPLWACSCGGLLNLCLEPLFPVETIARRPPGLWRYREALPIGHKTEAVSLGEPMTPLLPTDQPGPLLKLDFLFPTGSFKDRGASVMLSKIRELGVRKIVEDSSGNAGAAIAAYSAKARVDCQVFVPAKTSPGKVRQIELYGANLVKIDGQRAEAAKAALQAAQRTYYASHSWNPYFLEGTKTVAFEIWEQLGRRVPDSVVTPVGNGTMLLGLYRGFKHLAHAGVVDQLPRVHGVQAAACAPLVKIFGNNLEQLPPMRAGSTVAEGIVISQPIRWRSILEAVRTTGGVLTQVDDSAILKSRRHWARRGLLMEPTAAAATAGYDRLATEGIIRPDEISVVTVTGTGIKMTAHF